MKKDQKLIKSRNELWQRLEVSFEFSDPPISSQERARQAKLKKLLARTDEQWVHGRLANVCERARRVFAENGFPTEPGVYFEPTSGPIEFCPSKSISSIPETLFERQDSGEGRICVWPNFQRIEKLTPPDFARSVLNIVAEMVGELKARGDLWRLVHLSLDLMEFYHPLATEDSGIAKNALSGAKASEGRSLVALNKSRDRDARLKIVQSAAAEYRLRPGKKQATAHHISGNKEFLADVNQRIAAAGLKMIKSNTIEKMLKKT